MLRGVEKCCRKMIMIDDSCESCISQFHKNLPSRPIASDSVIVPMLIIELSSIPSSTARNWHRTTRFFVFKLIFQARSVVLPGRYLSSPYFAVKPSSKEDEGSAIKTCQRNNRS